ncbi:MAG: orotate phosphoribosyltransferase [Burkholderiales bacterium]|nr:orotate phosphoribosyltransferase [Burkholderiales bacterium]MDQ3195310.1 orotate phosphoribosyltransferase [Pseudomonadota bacterium]
MSEFSKEFIRFAVGRGALRFGEFTTKAGRVSPYFFNAGLFDDGRALRELAQFYAKAIATAGIAFDMLFGPAYKGIPLAVSLALAMAENGQNLPFCFNRKEAKDHGEGGQTIGAPLNGRVLIIDDVISAGTSVRESIELIRAQGAVPCGLAIALDRMERGAGSLSAQDEIEQVYDLPVIAIATLDDLVSHLRDEPAMAHVLLRVARYREQFGANTSSSQACKQDF